ncbi:YjjG family noncanonical pyrimidine nucleotidase [Massilimicrobiota sp. An134]|uniref:YjjG family noncanonical pyrimidine nucleotidase n=1 Tax=Massilimicrobiota sp. An134 TaxID=1965557 RepID=UPI000B366C0F|nr:YjjG family noncanonical pyrimidine nucleotidase [Massilimicrobiota sp. An134]OUQ30367.1 noncanonical pyrimidine nucleotidase, YjjG family [Massilimicrobiota sp. An134]
MKKYKYLLFDVDGTLLDFDKAEQHALEYTFRHYDIPLTYEINQRYEEINKKLWKDFENGLIDKKTVVYSRFVLLFKEFNIPVDGIAFEDDYQKALGQGYFVLPHTIEVLSALYQKYPLYVVTNGVSQTQYSRLEGTDIKKYFQNIFVSEDIGHQKPSKEYFDYCFKNIDKIDLSKTLIIGDSLSSDIQGGINAGINTCWFNPNHLDKPEAMPINYEIHDLRELLQLL